MLLLYFLQNSSSYCLLSLFLQENYSPLSPYFFCPVLSLFLLELWTVAVLDCPGFPQSIYMVCSLLLYFSLCVSTLVISRELCIISAIPSVCCDKNPNESIKCILFLQEYFWFILWQFSTNMRQILPISNHNFPHTLSWDPLTLPPFTSKSSPSPSSLLFYNPLNSTVLSGCTWVWDHSPQCGQPTSRHSPEERWLSLPQQPSITNCSLAKSPASRSPLPPLLAYWLTRSWAGNPSCY